MTEEEQKTIKEQVAARYPDCDVRDYVIEGHDDLYFVMVSPSRDEWKKYRTEIRKAAGDDMLVAEAVERCALALIKYPERAEVQRLFNRRPGMPINFHGPISQLAGVAAEAVEKK